MLQKHGMCYKQEVCGMLIMISVTQTPLGDLSRVYVPSPSDGWMIKVLFLTFILEFCQKSKTV